MTKTIIETSTKNKYTLKQLKRFRQEAVDYVDVWRLQAVNALIAKYARKYKLDYYSL